MIEEYIFQKGQSRDYAFGSNRDEAYRNLSPVNKTIYEPTDGKKLRDVASGPLELNLKRHQAEVDDG